MNPEQSTVPVSNPVTSKSPARCIAITSGKGGVGKTNISTNLGLALAQQGKKVCLFDADTSLANVNILLNLQPEFTLEHLLSGQKTLAEIMMKASAGIKSPAEIDVIPAASGIAEITTIDTSQQQILLAALKQLEQDYDYILIDTAAGIAENVTLFLQSVEQCLLVITPEPTSLTDAFALLKIMQRKPGNREFHVVVNMADNYPESVDMYKRLAAASRKYLKLPLHYFGYLPRDRAMLKAVQEQVPVLLSYPGSAAAYRFHALGESIHRLYLKTEKQPSFSRFWEQHLGFGRIKTAAESRPAVTPTVHKKTVKYSKAQAIRMQQQMVQLIKSRTLSAPAMKSLLASLAKCTDAYYPEFKAGPAMTRRDKKH